MRNSKTNQNQQALDAMFQTLSPQCVAETINFLFTTTISKDEFCELPMDKRTDIVFMSSVIINTFNKLSNERG